MNAATINANTLEMNEEKTLFERIVDWRVKHISDNQFVLLLAFIVGILAAFAAFVLHWLIHQIQTLLVSGFSADSENWMFLVFPVVGIWLTSLFIKYVVKDNISHGITRVLYSISYTNLQRERILKKKRIYYLYFFTVLNHFTVHLKLTQHCKSTIFQ